MVEYLIGYRTTGIGGCQVPYVDVGAVGTLEQANTIVTRLRRDFPDVEWRVLGVRA